jgi:hypothetical protein
MDADGPGRNVSKRASRASLEPHYLRASVVEDSLLFSLLPATPSTGSLVLLWVIINENWQKPSRWQSAFGRSRVAHDDRAGVLNSAAGVMAAPDTGNAVRRDGPRDPGSCARRCRIDGTDTIDPVRNARAFGTERRHRQQKHHGTGRDSLAPPPTLGAL